MKIISWNINGLRNIFNKRPDGTKILSSASKIPTGQHSTLLDLIQTEAPDVLCLQEVRCSDTAPYLKQLANYFPHIHHHPAQKKGYAGTMILSTTPPSQVLYEFLPTLPPCPTAPPSPFATEGRMITAFFPEVIVTNLYAPHSRMELERLPDRLFHWEAAVLRHTHMVSAISPAVPHVLCGDLNVAHTPADIRFPPMLPDLAPCYTPKERQAFQTLLNQGRLLDTFRHLHPDTVAYTALSVFNQYRLDYFLLSQAHTPQLQSSTILANFLGSDHLPLSLELQPQLSSSQEVIQDAQRETPLRRSARLASLARSPSPSSPA